MSKDTSNDENLDQNLTTDACPTPPRQEETEEKPPSPKIEHEEFTSTESAGSTFKVHNSKKSSKQKKNITHAVATVINISQANGVHIGSNYTFNMDSKQNPKMHKAEVVQTKAISKLLASNIKVTKDHISFISTHVGHGWRATARALNYSKGQIDQFCENYDRLGVKEVVYQLLLDWCQNCPKEATIGSLTTALWNSEEQDVVRLISEEI